MNWSEAEVRELLSISQEGATQYQLPTMFNAEGEPYTDAFFLDEWCDSPWVEHTPIASWMDPFDTGWLCESPGKQFCATISGGQGAWCLSEDDSSGRVPFRERWERVGE